MAPNTSLRWMPVAIAGLVVATTVSLALGARDIRVFVATVFLYIPALLLTSLGLAIWGFAEKHPGRRISILSAIAAIVFIIPICYIVGIKSRDRIVFAFWSRTHDSLIKRYATKDGIVSYWDRWGFAGMENDSYLVASHGHELSSSKDATTWVRRRGWKCQIVNVQQMRRDIYIMTTYECAIDQ